MLSLFRKFRQPPQDRFAAFVRMVDRTQARVDFSSDGRLRWANANFCAVLGYELDEIVGKHHAIFCRTEFTETAAYVDFWDRLRGGESFTGEFERVSKSGESVWISAVYGPLVDLNGQVTGVAKIAHDITPRKLAVARISEAVEALARNDLTVRIDLPEAAGFGNLDARFNDAIARLETGLGRMRTTLDFLQDAARDGALQAGQVATRAQADAAQSRETMQTVAGAASALTEAAALVTQCLDGVQGGTRSIEAGSTAMNTAVDAARQMQDQTRALGDINGLIDDLSFQTALLALNAGVEAARAGAAGTGFSVVAAEIRGLAQRSAGASRDIAARVGEIVEQVNVLVSSIDNSDAGLKRLAGDLAGISADMEQVAAATEVQSRALDRSSGTIADLTRNLESTVSVAHDQAASSRGQVDRLDETARELKVWWNR